MRDDDPEWDTDHPPSHALRDRLVAWGVAIGAVLALALTLVVFAR